VTGIGRNRPLTRLAAMPRMKRLSALFALAALVAAISGCGSDDVSGTIPQDDAQQLIADLNAVEAAAASQNCATAEARAQEFVEHVNELPAPSGEALKATLREAGGNLEQLVREPCASGATGLTGEQPTSKPTTSEEATQTTTATSATTTTSTPTDEETPPAGPSGEGNGNGGENGGGPPSHAGPPGGPPGQDGSNGGGAGGSTGGTGGTGTGD
jgi:hypothetical protein